AALLALLPARAVSAPPQTGYLTGAPVPDWFGLATLRGRDAIQISSTCRGVVPGVNVILRDGGELQVIDPISGVQPEACSILLQLHMPDVPCVQNAAGTCDVAFSR